MRKMIGIIWFRNARRKEVKDTLERIRGEKLILDYALIGAGVDVVKLLSLFAEKEREKHRNKKKVIEVRV